MSEATNDPETRRRRILYRAAHRGTKEMDWLLGRFAEAEVSTFDEEELDSFEAFLSLPDPEIQQWLMDPASPRPPGEAGRFVERLKKFHDI